MIFATILMIADLLVIPYSEKSGVVTDGRFSKEEYAKSSMMGGLVNIRRARLAARDGDVFLTADREALHVAVKWVVEGSETDGGFVAQVRKDGDKKLCFDDVTEIFVADKEGNSVYQLMVNAVNCKSWTGSGEMPKTACKVTDGFWMLEAAIPWAAIPEVDRKEFKFNLARNFVAANLGYASLSGQAVVRDAKKMITVKCEEGFEGVRVYGMGTALIGGRYRLNVEGAKGLVLKSEVMRPIGNRQHEKMLENDPKQEQIIEMGGKDEYRSVKATVSCKGLGLVYQRAFVPFEGGNFAGGPVTDKRRVEGFGYSYTRRYSSAAKVAVIAEGLPKDEETIAELRSPGGKTYSARFERNPDATSKAMIAIPKEEVREAGEWVGAYVIGKRRVEAAFGFKEEKFPWTSNRIGISTKILEPFTPIELDGRVLKTVLREHRLGDGGLLEQVKALNEEVLAGGMVLVVKKDGKEAEFKAEDFKVVEAKAHQVKTKARGMLGKFGCEIEVDWEYDGLAKVMVKLDGSDRIDAVTLRTPLKNKHAQLFHSLVDMTRGNPAGTIPSGNGVVWDSSKLLRRKNPMGSQWVPGEFCPYLWLGAEERGIAFVFDSPRGYDLEDGKPMLRLVRAGEMVVAECDIMNRPHEIEGKVEFAFAFQVTPVKPRCSGWKKWNFGWGQTLPGMMNILMGRECGAASFPKRYLKQPDDTNKWCYAHSMRKVTRERRPDLNTLVRLAREDYQECLDYGEKNQGFLKSMGYRGGVKGFADMHLNYIYDEQVWQGMTVDRMIPYNCSSIINVDDPGYAYNKAEWSTLVPYARAGGTADRCFLTPSLVDYLLWCYRQQLKNGMDGIYFDEQYVIPQTNPDLSTVRDYKGRCIPEMGILAGRELYKRLAYLMDEMKMPERLIFVHATNTMIVPEFSFATACLVWEYDVCDVFQSQFPFDYCRAHSSGLQAGLVSTPLVLNKDPNRAKMTPEEFHAKRQHLFRTALALTMQHEMWQTKMYWGDDLEYLRARQIFWNFGTHLDDAKFYAYWREGNPFKVSKGYYIGAYERLGEYLIIISSDVEDGYAKLDLPKDVGGELMDAYTGEAVDPQHIKVVDHEFRLLFLGSKAFGRRLKPVEADYRYIHK